MQIIQDGDPAIDIVGAPWPTFQNSSISIRSLAARILCKRHNESLSELDRTAGDFFKAILTDQLAQAEESHPERQVETFTLLQGPFLERWILKLALGGLASKAFITRDGALNRYRASENYENILDVLWRGTVWPPGWGLYSVPHEIDPKGTPKSIGIRGLSGPNVDLMGVTVELGAIHLTLTFGAFDNPSAAIHRPSGFALRGRGSTAIKAVALAWPESGHRSIDYTRQN